MSHATTPRERVTELGGLALLWVAYAALVSRFWFVCDDAYITFRYAKNLAAGHGPRFNLGAQPPVEGYSNFAWMMWAALLEWSGLDTPNWMAATSFVLGSLLLWVLYGALRRLGVSNWVSLFATASLALFPPFIVWSTGGLATVAAALLLFVAFDRLVLCEVPSAVGAAAAGLGLALVRVEGVAWALLVALAFFVVRVWSPSERKLRWERTRPVWIYAAVVGVAFAGHSIFRALYYGAGSANTVSAKVSPSFEMLGRGADYVISYWLAFLTPLVVLVAIWLARKIEHRIIAWTAGGFVIANVGFCVVVSGDFMAMGRLFVVTLPFGALVLGLVADHLVRQATTESDRKLLLATSVVLITVGLVPAFDVHFVPRSAREAFHFRHNTDKYRSEAHMWSFTSRVTERWADIGRAAAEITEPTEWTVRSTIGAFGYYADVNIYDSHGLVNAEVAAQPIRRLRSPGHDHRAKRDYFLKDKPDLLGIVLVKPRELDDIGKRSFERVEHLAEIGHFYVPEFHAAANKRILTLQRRAPSGEDFAARIAQARQQLAALGQQN